MAEEHVVGKAGSRPSTPAEWGQHARDHLNEVERAVEHLVALAQSDDAAEPSARTGE